MVTQPPARPTTKASTSMYAVATGRADPRRQHVHERLHDVRGRPVDARPTEEAEHQAAERRLVDERRTDRVDDRARVRADGRAGGGAVAQPGERRGLGDPDRAEGQARRAIAPRPVAEAQEQVGGGRRVDERAAATSPSPTSVPGRAAAEGGRGRRRPARRTRRPRSAAASRRRRIRRPVRPTATRRGAASSTDGRAPSGLVRAQDAPGRPPAGSRRSRRASCAACPPSASRAACACA